MEAKKLEARREELLAEIAEIDKQIKEAKKYDS